MSLGNENVSGKKTNKSNRSKFNSIKTKLIVSLIAICIIPLTIVGFGSYTKSRSKLDEKLKVTSQQTLSEVNSGISDYFNGFISLIAMASSNYNIINCDNDANMPYTADVLTTLEASNSDISNVFLARVDGKYEVYPNEKMPNNFVATESPWYKQAIEHKGQIIVTLPFKDAQKNIMVVSVAKAVVRENKLLGVISMNISLSSFSDKISKKTVGDSGYVYITDLEGKNMIAHPKAELIGTDEASKLPVWNEIKTKDSGFIKYTFNGANKFGAYCTNKITGWKLVASMNETELTNDTNPILTYTLIIGAIMGAIAIVISIILSGGIAKNINNLKEVFEKASNGDLTAYINVTTKDEFKDLAESFNQMMANISALMNSVKKSSKEVLETSSNLASMSEEVTASIEEVSKAIGEVSEGATNQAQSAQKGAEEISGLSIRLDKVAAGSNEVDKLSMNTKDLGSKGLSMIDTLIQKSNQTKDVTTEVSNIVQDMNESTKKINTISETISQITEQTNLLSLNASIESARAGEAGKGFAVVAEEIRKLAEQSKQSTEEIKVIIANIQQKSDVAVQAIKVTKDVVNQQDAAVGETKEIFGQILKSIENVISKVVEMKVSITEIESNKENVVQEIEGISSVSQETASATEEVTASTEEINSAMINFTSFAEGLQTLAERLEEEMKKFTIE